MANKLVHFVPLTDSFIMLDAKLLKPPSCTKTTTCTFTGPLIISTFEKRAPVPHPENNFRFFFVIKLVKNSSTWFRKNSKKETLRTVSECRYIYQILTGMNASASLYSHPENASSYFKVICYLCFTLSISISVSSDTPNLKLVQWGAFKDNTPKILCKLLSANTKCTATAGPADWVLSMTLRDHVLPYYFLGQ